MEQRKRDFTLAEIKTEVEDLAGKVTAEGMELYEKIKMEVEELMAEFDEMKFDEKLKELEVDLAKLAEKVSDEGKEIIEHIHTRIDDLLAVVEEELAEIKEEGMAAWLKENKKVVVIGAVVVVVIIAAIANMMGIPTPA